MQNIGLHLECDPGANVGRREAVPPLAAVHVTIVGATIRSIKGQSLPAIWAGWRTLVK